MVNEKQNLESLFATVHHYFSPKIIGEVNDVFIKIVKVKGKDVPWHTHNDEDEMFYVFKGSLTMELRNEKSFSLNEGELYVVRRGTEHRVHSEAECWLILVENRTTKHTGNVQSHITKTVDEQRY